MSDNISQLGKNYSILDLYLEYNNLYRTKYGENTVIFCQVGDFFEIYAVINESEEVGPNIYKLADILGIQVTRRNKSNIEVNRSNYLMSGFPLTAIQKHIQTLVSHSYTVVVVRQITQPPNVKREVTEIVSPSMTLSLSTPDANHILVMMFNYDSRWMCGLAAMDVSTGHSMIYEFSSTIEDPYYVFDEITRILNTYATREIVLLCTKMQPDKKEYIIESIGLNQRITGIHKIWDQYADVYNKKEYQEAIMSKAGIGKGILSNTIMSGMDDTPLACIAFSYLIQFAHDHNPKLIQKLEIPRRLMQDNRLTLQYNSALQLNIIGYNSQNETPLLSILNRCVTSMGSRLYRDRMLNPIVNRMILQERYDAIDMYIEHDLYRKIRKNLTSILDIERISRRMVAETYHPCDWVSFHASLMSAIEVTHMLNKSELSNTIDNVICSYKHIIDLDEASKYMCTDIRGNIFVRGIYPDIDELSNTIQKQLQILQNIIYDFSNLGGDTTLCKLDCNDRDGYFLSTTKKRWNTIHKLMLPEKVKEYTFKPISSVSNTLRITSQQIEKASDIILRSQAQIASITHERYKEFLREFIERNVSYLHNISHEIAQIDVYSTNAMNAIEYRYVRPNLVDLHNTEDSYVEIMQLRHPIIERIQQKIDYVANNIAITPQHNGVLLYGVNASGKSSLMKAIGLAIIMAQSGMYVPCSELKLVPYHSIFTRISGNDNIYQGMSSFAVEMTELKHILMRTDHRSLVLGDELCAGTESISALSIVASGIDMLLKKRATFVFATHLHELLNIPVIKEYAFQEKVRIYHMHTEVQNGRIIYDRTLRNGSGADTYGIEVCRGLGLPNEFMYLAENIRKHLTNENSSFVSEKKSRYNSNITMDICAVCKTSRATETHHIRYQEDADKKGYIKNTHIHKNYESNLVPLCNQCHQREHHGILKIHGWKQSTEGIELDYEFIDKKNTTTDADMSRNYEIDDLVNVWKPYLRYSRKGWMLKKTSRFKLVPEDTLLDTLAKIQWIPSFLIPKTTHEIEHLQTRLLDASW